MILYEEVARSVRRAQRAFEEHDIERRTLALTHALDVIGHLQATLDFERGGEVAHRLSQFYTLMRARILETNVRADKESLESLAQEFTSFAQVWRQVEQAVPQPQNSRAGAQARPDEFRLRGALVET